MKAKTKIIIALCVSVFIGLIIVVKMGSNMTEPGHIKHLYTISMRNPNLLGISDVDLTLDLKSLKSGNEFYFLDMFWNTTFEQVMNNVPYALLEDPDRMQSPKGYAYYISEDEHDLYDQTATATFEFYDDQLKMVQLDFDSAKKPKVLYKSIVEALTDIYGEESEQFENEDSDAIGYKWEAENTILQVTTDGTHVIISVGIRETF